MGGPLKFKFANHFIIYQKSPLRGLLGLAGYTQSSGTGELRFREFLIGVGLADKQDTNQV